MSTVTLKLFIKLPHPIVDWPNMGKTVSLRKLWEEYVLKGQRKAETKSLRKDLNEAARATPKINHVAEEPYDPYLMEKEPPTALGASPVGSGGLGAKEAQDVPNQVVTLNSPSHCQPQATQLHFF
eukprot:319851-Amphidinium_carterae.2